MNKIFVDISNNVQATTEIKTVGTNYELIANDPNIGEIKIVLNFNQLDDAIDEMRKYNCEPTFEELEDKVEALERELEKYKSKN
ncbi:TPA: hypothetical protein I9063_002921 [Clostridium perfringens]|uniref:Uncharacterized protein n=1 Tax=Clostridium perfringens TaxID=1502 RepID=A0AAN5NE45_CLOPF|nr:hypothetical protein [Clostridium perfringens]QTZ83024.1 hypothetical protein phiCPE_00048 [Clostridium phage vB_CpeS-1181]AQW28509.1 hypothetical protein BXT94_17470 [Clostridium perfringens]MDJ8951036.1 hypothetical protein [Clostridium perfringens]PWW86589.1 hypothetical protein CYK79_16720 [Clostridium perfringens]PWW90374.1 hypothetical protein CYK84_14585 [Clostridium perfringens]